MKIVMLTGLDHHVTRMASVTAELEARGHEVLFVSSQNPYGDHLTDFEIPLRRTGRPYRLLSEFRDDPAYPARIATHRRRVLPAVRERFLAGQAPPWFALGTGGDLSVAEVLEDEATMEIMLEREAPDAVVVLHESNFWTRTLSSVSARLGIPFYCFQEGLFYHLVEEHHLREFGALSRKAFLWGPRDLNRMVDAGSDPNGLLATGPTHLCPIVREMPTREEAKEQLGLDPQLPVVLLVVPNGIVTQLEGSFLGALAGFMQSNPKWQFATKWRAIENGQHKPRIEAFFKARLRDRYHSFALEDPYLVCAAADCVLSQATTLGCEAVGLGCPVLEIAWGDAEAKPILDLQDLAGVERITGSKDLPRIADYVLNGIPESVQPLNDAFREECLAGLRGDATLRVVDFIEADVPAYRSEFGPVKSIDDLETNLPRSVEFERQQQEEPASQALGAAPR